MPVVRVRKLRPRERCPRTYRLFLGANPMVFPPHLLLEAFAQVSSLFILQMAHFCELRVTPVDPPVLSGMTPLPGGCWHRFPEPCKEVSPLLVGRGTKTHSPVDWTSPRGWH